MNKSPAPWFLFLASLLLSTGSLFAESPNRNHAQAEYHYSRALALSIKGEWGEGTEEYREAVRWDPDWARAHYDLGVSLSLKGDTDEVIKEYREAVRLKPDFLDALVKLAEALDAKGERKEARVYWKKAEKVAEDSESSPLYEAWINKRLAERTEGT
jgi:tetratricopeptide (TPR) repeat protein